MCFFVEARAACRKLGYLISPRQALAHLLHLTHLWKRTYGTAAQLSLRRQRWQLLFHLRQLLARQQKLTVLLLAATCLRCSHVILLL